MPRIQFDEADDLIDICKDNVFKAVFTKNTPESKGALSRLVSALIGRKVSIIAISANEPPVENTQDRQIRFDINCKAKSGEFLNVEMSLNPDPFEPVRLEFYAGKLFTGQDIKGVEKSFNDLKRAYQISILAREKFFPDGVFFHTFEYFDKANGVSLNGRSSIITLELSKLNKVVEKPTEKMSLKEQWAVYFKYLTDKRRRSKINEILEKEEGIAMASKVLMTISKDEAERFRLMSEEKYQLDMQSKMVYAKRLAMKEGLRKGEQIGLRKGENKGREEGRKEGQQDIIELLKSGKSPKEIIQEYTQKQS